MSRGISFKYHKTKEERGEEVQQVISSVDEISNPLLSGRDWFSGV
jgi:hypothetical protein